MKTRYFVVVQYRLVGKKLILNDVCGIIKTDYSDKRLKQIERELNLYAKKEKSNFRYRYVEQFILSWTRK